MENLKEGGHRSPVWFDELRDVLDRLLQEDKNPHGATLLSIVDRLAILEVTPSRNNGSSQLLEFKPTIQRSAVGQEWFADLESSDVLLARYPEEIRHAVRRKVVDVMLSGEIHHWGWLQLSILLQQTAHVMMQGRER